MLLWSGASALSSAVSVSVVLLSLAALVGNAIHLSDVTVHPIRAEIFQIQGVDVVEDDTDRLRRGSASIRRYRCVDCDRAVGIENSANEQQHASRARRQATIQTAATEAETKAEAVAIGVHRGHHHRTRQPSQSLLPNSPEGSYSLGPGGGRKPSSRGGHRNGGGGGGGRGDGGDGEGGEGGDGGGSPGGKQGGRGKNGVVKYYYPERQPLPLPKCFHNPTGYVCCNEKLNDLIVDTYTSLEQKPKFHQCNVQLIAVHLQLAAEKDFDTPFETVVGYEDFAQKLHFRGDMVCKVELGGRYMLAYATAAEGYEPNSGGPSRSRRNTTASGMPEVGYADSWTSIHTSFI